MLLCCFFFFQAEDGIRDVAVTGVQTCALPISRGLASRLILFRVYYLGGAEYHTARKHLGISELTWADWADEIRDRVGRELLRAGMFPPGRYFHEPSDEESEGVG